MTADYVLALKRNHPTLHGEVKYWFEQHLAQGFEDITHSYDERVEKGHHRTEKRQVWCVPISQLPPLHNQDDWLGLKCVVMVVRVRHLWNKTTREVQFYLTSLDCDARKLGQAIRLHWGVENGIHWTMDVTFNEDACRVRTGHAPPGDSGKDGSRVSLERGGNPTRAVSTAYNILTHDEDH